MELSQSRGIGVVARLVGCRGQEVDGGGASGRGYTGNGSKQDSKRRSGKWI